LLVFQERVGQYEKFVGEHQEYSDSYNGCVEWLNSVREKLSACSDVSGDRHAIQSRLDKIQVGGEKMDDFLACIV
jgi:nesprin-1